MGRDASEDIRKPGLRIDPIDLGRTIRLYIAAASFRYRGEQTAGYGKKALSFGQG
jgi:hypothetical protein